MSTRDTHNNKQAVKIKRKLKLNLNRNKKQIHQIRNGL